jgi:hypothetical protein
MNEIKEQYERDYLDDTVYLLQKRLLDYSDDGLFPLCEFLSLEQIENYVDWLFIHCQ